MEREGVGGARRCRRKRRRKEGKVTERRQRVWVRRWGGEGRES